MNRWVIGADSGGWGARPLISAGGPGDGWERGVGGQALASAVTDHGAGGQAEAAGELFDGMGPGESAYHRLLFYCPQWHWPAGHCPVDSHLVDQLLRSAVA